MKVGGSGRLPLIPVAAGAGVIILVGLIAYLVLQAGGGSSLAAWQKAQADSSSSIPGTFHPTEGRDHFAGGYAPGRVETPFCPGVVWSGAAEGVPSPTPPAETPTPAPTQPGATPTWPGCYNSNPPSSGKHLASQNNVDLGSGYVGPIPPDPGVYMTVEFPRDAIPHILEHAGVFVGYNCASGDSACNSAVDKVKALVTDRLHNGKRVVLAHDNDLLPGTIGMSSWTRVYDFKYQDYDAKEAQRFIDINSCRFDPEGECP